MRLFGILSRMFSHFRWRITNAPADIVPSFFRLVGFTLRAFGVTVERAIAKRSDRYTVHAAIHTTGNNIGDMALPVAIREAFDATQGPVKWYLQPLWKPIDEQQREVFSKKASLMIVGGGGLFLSHPEKPSGWHWNISHDELEKLDVPLCIFAVGFNRFRGQDEFRDGFAEHVELTARKSLFIGLRNTGSLERISEYLSEESRKKLRIQPCLTTVLNRFYPTYKPELRRPDVKELAINAAFDRASLRFGGSDEKMRDGIAKIIQVAKWAHENGWKIHLTYHSFEDALISEYFAKEKIPFDGHWLPRERPEKVFDFYTGIPLVLGMRGHSQMIPFGLGCMILPIITHDKLVYFMDEINKSHWGAELGSESASETLIEQIKAFDASRDTFYGEIEKEKDRLWDISKANMDELAQYLTLKT